MHIIVGNIAYIVEPGSHLRYWKRVSRGEWEPETFRIFDDYIRKDTLFLDIGAWIGSTALYGVQRAERCVAFEPDPVAFAALKANLAANAGADWAGRLEINECAINKDGTSFILGGSEAGADSMSSGLFPGRANQWTVSARRLPDILEAHRKPGQPVFLKIDIEGGEYDLLPGLGDILADPLVTAYISFHPKMLDILLHSTLPEEEAKATCIERHLAVIDSFPTSRRLSGSDGAPIDRAELREIARNPRRFPTELLLGDPR